MGKVAKMLAGSGQKIGVLVKGCVDLGRQGAQFADIGPGQAVPGSRPHPGQIAAQPVEAAKARRHLHHAGPRKHDPQHRQGKAQRAADLAQAVVDLATRRGDGDRNPRSLSGRVA
ncbi:hypothetical protein ACFSYD_08635 [Paracoccus aerius]